MGCDSRHQHYLIRCTSGGIQECIDRTYRVVGTKSFERKYDYTTSTDLRSTVEATSDAIAVADTPPRLSRFWNSIPETVSAVLLRAQAVPETTRITMS